MARTTCFVTGASNAIPKGGVHFSSEIVIVGGSFAPGQVLSFGSLDYIADYSGDLHHLEETSSEDNESPASYPLLGLLGDDLEVLPW
jgi:hypothetical protein